MNYEDLQSHIKLDDLYVDNELNIKIRDLFTNCIMFTPKRIITEAMKDLIVKCFAIASIPNFNNKDLNYIKSELKNAGFFFERKNYQLHTSDPFNNNKWFFSIKEVWNAIGKSNLDDVYSVCDINGNIVDEFIPY